LPLFFKQNQKTEDVIRFHRIRFLPYLIFDANIIFFLISLKPATGMFNIATNLKDREEYVNQLESFLAKQKNQIAARLFLQFLTQILLV